MVVKVTCDTCGKEANYLYYDKYEGVSAEMYDANEGLFRFINGDTGEVLAFCTGVFSGESPNILFTPSGCQEKYFERIENEQ